MILALANNKGGVGKTTTAVNLSAALALRGRRVLLVDMDAQCSASLSLGIREARRTLADVLFNGAPARDAIEETQVQGLSLLPAHPDISNADVMLSNVQGRERILSRALESIAPQYDFVILDSPPSLSLLVVNALAACQRFIIPTVPQYLALEGLAGFLRAADAIRANIGGGALLGIVLTAVDYRTRAAVEIADMIRGHFGGKVFRAEIRINTRLAEAPSFGRSIFQYDPHSTGAAAYTALADEVTHRAKARK